jgi:hypothetical protein
MEISIVIFILLIHFLADFGLQTHEQSQKKSSSNRFLFYHVAVYSAIWFLALCAHPYTDVSVNILYFTIVTFVLHFSTDYITSRIGKPFWEKQDFHNGFVVVGFDQLLHYIQLIWCWYLLF